MEDGERMRPRVLAKAPRLRGLTEKSGFWRGRQKQHAGRVRSPEGRGPQGRGYREKISHDLVEIFFDEGTGRNMLQSR